MTTSHILYALAGAEALLIIAFIVLAVKLRGLRKQLDRIAAVKQVEPSAELIREWRKKLKMYPEGSPKHTAYRNRLASLE